MFAKYARRGFRYLILIAVAALAAGPASGRAWAQGAGEPALDQLFEQAFAAVIGIADPLNRLYMAQRLSEADVNYGGGRLETRLVSILGPGLGSVPDNRRDSALSYNGATLATYGRTSELLAVMLDLNDAWNYGSKVLRALVKKGDVTTAVILAERESKAPQRFSALINIVEALAEGGQKQQARGIFDQAQSIYNGLGGVWKDSRKPEYLTSLAHFDLGQAESLALAVARDQPRARAILGLVKTMAKSDPERALGLAMKINVPAYRGYAASAVIRATAEDPDRQRIYERAMREADPLGRAYALRNAARRFLAKGQLGRASGQLDRLDLMLPTVPGNDQGRFGDLAAYRLVIALLSADANRVFEKMGGLTYTTKFKESAAVWIIANALRENGHYDLGRRVAAIIQGTTNHAGYFINAINSRFE